MVRYAVEAVELIVVGILQRGDSDSTIRFTSFDEQNQVAIAGRISNTAIAASDRFLVCEFPKGEIICQAQCAAGRTRSGLTPRKVYLARKFIDNPSSLQSHDYGRPSGGRAHVGSAMSAFKARNYLYPHSYAASALADTSCRRDQPHCENHPQISRMALS